MPRPVLILGATGHIGSTFARACAARGLRVSGASRRGGEGCEALDLREPASWARFEEHEVVINATDTARVPVLPMARHCLEHGVVFVETSADPAVFEELLALDSSGCSGAVIAGAGAFPGLSTYLLEHAGPDHEQLDFVASWSVLSGAGPGTVEVMLDGLREPARALVDGARRDFAPLARLKKVEIGGRRGWAIALGMPDVVLAAHASSARDIGFWAAVRPRLPGWALRLVGWLARHGVFSLTPVAALTRASLRFLRGFVFARARPAIRLELRAGDELLAGFETEDAFTAGASSVAILAERWPSSLTGVALPQRGVPLEQMRRELGDEVRFFTEG